MNRIDSDNNKKKIDKGNDERSILTLQVSQHINIHGVDNNDGLLLLLVLPTRIFRTGEHNALDLTVLITNISDHIDKTERNNKSNINDARHNEDDIDITVRNNEEQDIRNITCNSAKHIGHTDIVALIPE